MYAHECEHCGVWLDAHDYEHLARECYPKQIKKLESGINQALKLLDEAQEWTRAGQRGDPNGAKSYQANKAIEDAITSLGGPMHDREMYSAAASNRNLE